MSCSFDLPPQWQAAIERGRAGVLTGTDPAQERKTARATQRFNCERAGLRTFTRNAAGCLEFIQFSLSGVTSSVPFYFYVTSFPKKRRLLVDAGLETLGRAREIPRTLKLAEAAAADGADIDFLIRRLQDFFRERQPRRRTG